MFYIDISLPNWSSYSSEGKAPDVTDFTREWSSGTRDTDFDQVPWRRTTEELGEELSISQVAVRQHLASLEAEDAVAISVERRGLGRPAHRYHLTVAGDKTFPRHYDTLSVMLRDELSKWQGNDAVVSLLERRPNRMLVLLQDRLKDKPLTRKVMELAQFQSENGYPGLFTCFSNSLQCVVPFEKEIVVHE